VQRSKDELSPPANAEVPRITVGIATYNGRRLLEVALASLRDQTFRDFRVVVVDDASTDDTVRWLSEHWPGIDVIVHPHNRGVTAALNSCLRAANSELVVLLNNDVELDPGFLGELANALAEHPRAGAACGKLIDYHHHELLDGAGDIYTWGGEANRRGHGELDLGQYDVPQNIFSACGAAAVYRRAALEQVGLFDERLFVFYEDVDWCFRGQLLGWDCRYVPTAVAYHMGSATVGREPRDFTLYYNWRNSIRVALKNYPPSALVRHAPALLFVQLRNLAIAVRRRRGRVWLRVWRDVLTGLPGLMQQRRRVQRSRVRSLSEFGALIASDSVIPHRGNGCGNVPTDAGGTRG
jgi:GT2 family glycosyltransferase